MSHTDRKKVLCPMQGKNGRTYWVKLGVAFTNRDGSTNVYLDALPTNQKLHIRDMDERDTSPNTRTPFEPPRDDTSFPGFLNDEGSGA